jgi:predicted ATP-dependent endonuclease of OLD family
LLAEAADAVASARDAVIEAIGVVNARLAELGSKAEGIRGRWDDRYSVFKSKLQQALEAAPGQQSLVALKTTLEGLQSDQIELLEQARFLQEEAEPALEGLRAERRDLITELMEARTRRRAERRERVKVLNERMSGIVKLDIPTAGDRAKFRELLNMLKVGSRVREDKLQMIAEQVHPAQFAEAMIEESYSTLVDESLGLDLETLGRLFVNIVDKDLWEELLEVQAVETPDTLNVKFKREQGDYVSVESLAHGQRCTAMLVTLIADGSSPVIVDQPEDALHAPWIEEHLVDRLRSLRGSRQFLFATRSPGLVISADAEQIITLRATAGRGEVEARGSLERHDLNRLVLHHLEGGAVPFRRRGRKLAVSVPTI